MKSLRGIAVFLSKPGIVFYSLPALMILLVAGTLAQAKLGLYDAHQQYFSGFVVWVGPFPLPGAYILIGLITLNLAIKFIFFSDWSWRKAGIHMAHLGTLVILLGGLFTALFAREGYMAIPEGESAPFVYDYHQRELAVFKNETFFRAYHFENLIPGQDLEGFPFTFTVLNACKNCEILRRAETLQVFVSGDLRDFAQHMALSRKPPEAEDEANLSGFTFNLSGLEGEQSGTYIAFEAMPRPVQIEAGGDTYAFIFGKQQRSLPFSITLKDFEKHDYPGSMMAQDYSSKVSVRDGEVEWTAVIAMNEPLRYKGYTFYQSSFEQSPEFEMTILSVVENKGRIFPYIGTVIIALGLMFHLAMVLRRKG